MTQTPMDDEPQDLTTPDDAALGGVPTTATGDGGADGGADSGADGGADGGAGPDQAADDASPVERGL